LLAPASSQSILQFCSAGIDIGDCTGVDRLAEAITTEQAVAATSAEVFTPAGGRELIADVTTWFARAGRQGQCWSS
jgi:hypothetical protein